MANDLAIGAMTVWMEARGEPDPGQLAVAWVLVNRLNSKRYGLTLAEVCLDPYQFSCWNTSDPNRRAVARCSENDPIYIACETAVQAALLHTEADPTNGATLYYSDTMTTSPIWASRPGVTFTAQIGHQKFFTES